jgi:glycosyltransferase involved in cell wall biosynthesis
MEQQLGHHSYYQNLRKYLDAQPEITPSWIEVTYEQSGLLWERWKIIPSDIRGTLTGRSQVRRGLQKAPYDAAFFNTQVPAALVSDWLKRSPYIISTDITPLQYDRLAELYEHKVSENRFVSWYKHHINKKVFQNAFRVLPWSRWTRRSLIDEYNLSRDKIDIVPPGVDLDIWHPKEKEDRGPVRILFVGGDFYRKGGDLLLEAFRSLPENSASLVLVTHTELEAAPGIEVYNNIQANSPELIALYQSSDIFVLPTRAEAFGIAAVEASAVGLPIVATQLCGLKDIVVQDETGYLVPVGDGRAFTEHLNSLVCDAELRRAMGKSGRIHAEKNFDAKRNAERIADYLFESVRVQ